MLTMATLTMATLTMAHLVELEQPRVAAARVDLLSNLYSAGAYFGAFAGGTTLHPAPRAHSTTALSPDLYRQFGLLLYLLATLD